MDKLFLDELELKERVPSSRNVSDTQTIFYSIKFSQLRELRPYLGPSMFDDLLNKKYQVGYVYTECESGLIDLIKEVLALMTYKRLVNHLSFKLRDGGLRYNLGGTDELAPTDDRQMILREITKDIDILLKEIDLYIQNNRLCFPLYRSERGCQIGEVKLNIGKI